MDDIRLDLYIRLIWDGMKLTPLCVAKLIDLFWFAPSLAPSLVDESPNFAAPYLPLVHHLLLLPLPIFLLSITKLCPTFRPPSHYLLKNLILSMLPLNLRNNLPRLLQNSGKKTMNPWRSNLNLNSLNLTPSLASNFSNNLMPRNKSSLR